MQELMAGYRRFRAGRWTAERETLAALAREGQHPHTLAIACSDSRVAPEMIFDVSPGEVFTVRNIANLVPPYAPDAAKHGTSAAVEFAVRVLKVKRIAVIGHSRCGGVAALLGGVPPEASDFLGNWMDTAVPARTMAWEHHPDDVAAAHHDCEIETVRVSLANLRGFPFVADAEAAGTLAVLGFYFEVATGQLSQVLPDRVLPIDELEPV